MVLKGRLIDSLPLFVYLWNVDSCYRFSVLFLFGFVQFLLPLFVIKVLNMDCAVYGVQCSAVQQVIVETKTTSSCWYLCEMPYKSRNNVDSMWKMWHTHQTHTHKIKQSSTQTKSCVAVSWGALQCDCKCNSDTWRKEQTESMLWSQFQCDRHKMR